MGDGYWRYSDAPRYPAASMPPPTAASAPAKRPRSDYADIPTGNEMLSYYGREDGRVGHPTIRDTESINASYDRYLRNGVASYGSGEPMRPLAGGITSRPLDDPRMVGFGEGRNVGLGGGRPDAFLPPDASNTLYVEGLPANCTRREASHIFRPFVGFREVRLVNKESRLSGGEPLVLCFVDFDTPSQAAVALDALQGYKFDEGDRESANLRLQFARFPGPKSSGGPRPRR